MKSVYMKSALLFCRQFIDCVMTRGETLATAQQDLLDGPAARRLFAQAPRSLWPV